MTMTDRNDHISRQRFMEELRRYQKGSVSRRHFLGVTGLGLATTVIGQALGARPAWAQEGIGDRVVLASWPNYHDPANFDAFATETGAYVDMSVFGSNEEMLAKLQAGGTGWDVFVPTNYTITSPSSPITCPTSLRRASSRPGPWTAPSTPCPATGGPRATS
jgi:spermidine/putrescine transport system substrate-binding protein